MNEMGVTAWTAGEDLKTWVCAFLVFRVLDILKPPPIGKVDRWSKSRTSRGWGGFGVMADDLVAALEGLAIVILLQKLKFLA